MKDPDGPCDSIQDAAGRSIAAIEGLDNDERAELQETREASLRQFASRWMRYGEYVTIEFDTEAQTAVVVETRDADDHLGDASADDLIGGNS
jgi:hypothetical protein